MKKNIILSAVLAMFLMPAIGMAADSTNSFERDAKNCDSWTWQDNSSEQRDTQKVQQVDKENLAFGDLKGIGW